MAFSAWARSAKRARAFDLEIHYHNRRRLQPADEQGAIYHDTLDSLLAVSDILSISAPSTLETRDIINAATLAKLPRGAIVVNTARGDLVHDDDLIAALKSGQVGYAGLDVFKGEPSIHPDYHNLDNVFLLPHMGTSAIEARDEMGFAALDNIDAVLAGREGVSLLVYQAVGAVGRSGTLRGPHSQRSLTRGYRSHFWHQAKFGLWSTLELSSPHPPIADTAKPLL